MSIRLIQCDERGQPVEPLGALPAAVAENCAASAQMFAAIGYVPPWVSYVTAHNEEAVGGCAFIGAPQHGKVEIAYFTLEGHEGRGYAGAAVTALVAIARAAAPNVTLTAKTLPEQNPSTAVLRRNGFSFAGETSDHEIGLAWAWVLAPASAKL